MLRRSWSIQQQRSALLFLQQSRLSHAQVQLKEILDETLGGIKSAGTWKEERIIQTPQKVAVRVQNVKSPILNFCANNYLGLANNREVIEASKEALDKYGAGLSSVRFICGTQDIHKELEGKIAKFHGREDAILYISCFDANAGIFEVLLGPEDAVFSDELNHASLIDGIRLCKAKKNRYKHRDMEDLERQLKDSSSSRIKLIVTDGVFSMDGTVAPLPQIVELAERYGALTLIDECHATGFYGSTGRGTEEYHEISGKIDIINSTLGKALGGAAGGYTTGSTELIQLLRQRSRPYLFSNSPPPAITATASKVFDLLQSPNQLISRLKTGTEKFRMMMKAAGFTISGDNHPICPVMIGDAALAAQFAEKMLGRGVYVVGFSYPVVPHGKARIRVQISAAHTEEDIDYCVDAFVAIGRELKLIS
ncbi:2-amino-3-ketobutyrate coenzyme A ligase, mitochondrial [Thrips palmi]|uniref:2-amino-3-ketobutyrate coenzyme A ligase, mitochondrial n=1 Tax=Thrips palmi TaxID=161013 RepID=A0A6P8ZR22_THRPL|nr:2-amino-3-ketobutyrate coenzyme A ligase, mitochondrial [Thrips palmi]